MIVVHEQLRIIRNAQQDRLAKAYVAEVERLENWIRNRSCNSAQFFRFQFTANGVVPGDVNPRRTAIAYGAFARALGHPIA